MNAEDRTEAILGAFDGVVSAIGFVSGLLVHHSPGSAIAMGGLGGAISASISMTTEKMTTENTRAGMSHRGQSFPVQRRRVRQP